MIDIVTKLNDFFNCEGTVDEFGAVSYVINKIDTSLEVVPNASLEAMSESGSSIYIKVTTDNYGRENCTVIQSIAKELVNEYKEFPFDEIILNDSISSDNEKNSTDKKSIFFFSRELLRALNIEISLEANKEISILDHLYMHDFNGVLAELLDVPEAEFDEEGVSHYILKESNKELVIDTTPIEEWTDDLVQDTLVLDYNMVGQMISYSFIDSKNNLSCFSSIPVRKIEKDGNKIVIYARDNFKKIEIQLSPVIKIANIYN